MEEGLEKLEILNMIKEGRLTPEQGVRLLEALESSEKKPASDSSSKDSDYKWLNIEIRARSTSKYKNITPFKIPLSVIRLFMRFIPKYSPIPGSNTSLEDLLDILESGKPIDLYTEGEDGRAFRIFAE